MDDHAVCGAGLATGVEGALSGQACPTFTDSGQYDTARPAWWCTTNLPQLGLLVRSYVRQACPTFAHAVKQSTLWLAW